MNVYPFSIIIPAYNESVLVRDTLTALFDDCSLINVEVLVVCNGCEDNTAHVVREFFHSNKSKIQGTKLNVLELEKASKTNAINYGIKQTSGKVKVLLDADIIISGQAIIGLVSELKERELLAISPKVFFSFENSSFLVRQYYQVAQKSIYNTHHRLSNVIALAESGIMRLYPLPEVIADDEYIRRQFGIDELAVSSNCSFKFICAKNLMNLIQVLTRVERGNLQLKTFSDKSNINQLKKGFNQARVFSLPFFVVIKLIAKTRAKLQFNKGRIYQWERDESNRNS